jgi:hypothetical protein
VGVLLALTGMAPAAKCERVSRYACKDSQDFYRQQLNRPDVQDVLKRHEPFITAVNTRPPPLSESRDEYALGVPAGLQ